MNQYLSTYKQEVLLLDNKRVLYSKNSQIDLLEFLKEIATTKTDFSDRPMMDITMKTVTVDTQGETYPEPVTK